MKVIKSRKNPYIKYVYLLNKKTKDDFFLIEGKKLVSEALCNTEPESLLVAQGYNDQGFLSGIEKYENKIIYVSSEVMNYICDTKTPQGIAAVIKKRKHTLGPGSIKSQGFYIILEGVSDPGNLGTLIRSANAFMVDGIILCSCVDLYNPKIVRSTMGAIFKANIFIEGVKAAAGLLKAKNITIFCSSLCPGSILIDAKISFGGSAVIIGNESSGVSKEAMELCDYKLKIPMSESTQSLNAAVAGSIFMWEAYKQKYMTK